VSAPFYVIASLLAMILLVQIVMLIGLRDYTPTFEVLRQQMAHDASIELEHHVGLLNLLDQIENKLIEEIREIRDVYRAVEDATKTIRDLDENLGKHLTEQTSALYGGLLEVRQAVIDLQFASGERFMDTG
jgi:hypothetical protein